MIRFYLKIENNMLINKLLYIITALVFMFNVALRIFPNIFIGAYKFHDIKVIVPIELFEYCDGYLLLLFIILLFFFLGTDFTNSMEDISLAVGGSKTNKFMLRKLISLLCIYMVLYVITFINIYTLYSKCVPNTTLIPLKEIILCSFATNVFVIALSLFLLFLFRDIIVSVTAITAFYLIEELLWRCRIFKNSGILGHIYRYYDYKSGNLYKVKIIYIVISVVLLFLTYLLSRRKLRFNLLTAEKE